MAVLTLRTPSHLKWAKFAFSLQSAYTSWEWHEAIFPELPHGLICFSSPFDESAVDFLEDLRVPAYKIASFENNHLPLIRKAASTGKPVIISTGMATVSDLDQAVCTAREAGCENLILLKCTSTYPATPENTNLPTIPHLRQLFDCEVGLSDHTMGVGTSVAAALLVPLSLKSTSRYPDLMVEWIVASHSNRMSLRL